MDEFVFKILSRAQGESLSALGYFSGSPDDERDGFIHLSFAHQLEGTLQKHFAGELDLLLLKMVSEKLGVELRLEQSRNQKKYPHLYRRLFLEDVVELFPVTENWRALVEPKV